MFISTQIKQRWGITNLLRKLDCSRYLMSTVTMSILSVRRPRCCGQLALSMVGLGKSSLTLPTRSSVSLSPAGGLICTQRGPRPCSLEKWKDKVNSRRKPKSHTIWSMCTAWNKSAFLHLLCSSYTGIFPIILIWQIHCSFRALTSAVPSAWDACCHSDYDWAASDSERLCPNNQSETVPNDSL